VSTPTGFTEDWESFAQGVPASIEPATPALVERVIGVTVTTPITHLVRLRYRSDVSAKHRVLFGSRALYIGGVQNIEERGRELVLACEERAA
jgi:SPP1 family predicted phage head-tail adaptor